MTDGWHSTPDTEDQIEAYVVRGMRTGLLWADEAQTKCAVLLGLAVPNPEIPGGGDPTKWGRINFVIDDVEVAERLVEGLTERIEQYHNHVRTN